MKSWLLVRIVGISVSGTIYCGTLVISQSEDNIAQTFLLFMNLLTVFLFGWQWFSCYDNILVAIE